MTTLFWHNGACDPIEPVLPDVQYKKQVSDILNQPVKEFIEVVDETGTSYTAVTNSGAYTFYIDFYEEYTPEEPEEQRFPDVWALVVTEVNNSEPTVSLHNNKEDALQELQSYLIDIYISDMSSEIESLDLECLLERYSGEISYHLTQTYLPLN